MSKKKKIRVELRKNRSKPPRENDLTRGFQENQSKAEEAQSGERVRAKGDLSRHRTVLVDHESASEMPAVSAVGCIPGRVLRGQGLNSYVEGDDGQMYRCSVRRLLKSLSTDERSVVTTGDRVWLRCANPPIVTPDGLFEGMIERVEPRHGVLTRASRRREHVLVSNVDQLVIVMSLVQPDLKPHLLDRYLISAEKGGLAPIVCLNKADLADPVSLQPMIGSYSRIGIRILLTSATTGLGIDRLKSLLKNRSSVFGGQSGVGKTSLLNALQPGLALKVKSVSETTQKGRHTTTAAELIRLDLGGWVVDTPGVRQLQLWDTRPEEVEGYFRDFRPFVSLCAFPDCTHTHEAKCAVKAAVSRHQIPERRYYSYLGLFNGVAEE